MCGRADSWIDRNTVRCAGVLITLASQNIVYGIAQLLTENNVIPCMKPEIFAFLGGGRLFGVPFSIYIMAIMAVLSWVILNKTVLGRNIYAVGGNAEACRLSGVRSRMVTIIAYVASGFTAALAGIVLASMNRQAIAKAAQGYDNFVLTALVVGGAFADGRRRIRVSGDLGSLFGWCRTEWITVDGSCVGLSRNFQMYRHYCGCCPGCTCKIQEERSAKEQFL